MDTKDCTILKTLAEENNITYAARRLFMTQPALITPSSTPIS